MAYTRMKVGTYLAIIDNQYMVEVDAKNEKEARCGAIAAGERANRSGCEYNLDNISVCKVPSMLCCINWID